MERLTEEFRSKRNQLFWRLRERLRFQRDGYAEAGDRVGLCDADALGLDIKYEMSALKEKLKPAVYQKNLATLWILEKMLGGLPSLGQDLKVLEPGCQDFARLPALRAYFAKLRLNARITGLEVDAYPLLEGFHSRADKARYYLSLPPNGLPPYGLPPYGLPPYGGRDRYVAGDFFRWDEPASLVICFYPFVSVDPALAWGLPKEFGAPGAWVRGFERNLISGGHLMVVHQGKWEEEAFDEARAGSRLELVARRNVDCRFYPLPHPACASVYKKV